MLDDIQFEAPEEEGPPPEESGNRTFLVVAGGLGAVLLLSLVCLAVYAFFIRPRSASQANANATTQAQNTEVALARTQTAAAAQITIVASITQIPTRTFTPQFSSTPEPSNTPPVQPTVHPSTATVQALLTQASLAQTQAAGSILTVTPTATSAFLPDTGFFDEGLGAPGLIVLSVILLMVILFTRRLRAANAG